LILTIVVFQQKILTKNNLIGFEHITFNQRTEHYFDRTYGNLGAKVVFNF